MTTSNQNLVWIDLEMTGLYPETDRILEVATIVTDSELNVLAEGPVCAIHQPAAVLDSMHEWCINTHSKSGLTERVKTSAYTEATAEQATLEFLEQYVPKGVSPMCGNSICQDRRFLARYMPALQDYFHYRHLDVSTLKILAQRWYPDVFKQFKKDTTHIALNDIYDSIEELKFYRQHLFITN